MIQFPDTTLSAPMATVLSSMTRRFRNIVDASASMRWVQRWSLRTAGAIDLIAHSFRSIVDWDWMPTWAVTIID